MKKHTHTLYTMLKRRCSEESFFHISTDMCPAHRTDTLNAINERLNNNLPCRIVSSQCIEAGVDLDVQVIFRALAPLDSIIQSAGRCNRNGNALSGMVIVFVPKEEDLYPSDDYYKRAANKVLLLLNRHNNNINIINEYYELLFTDGSSDDIKLINAVETLDFEKKDERYKLIKNTEVNVIVPYTCQLKLYDEVKDKVLQNGITSGVMTMARTIAVSSFMKDKVEEICERLYFSKKYGNEKVLSNWYILNDSKLYDKAIGFKLRFMETMQLPKI